jgi:hypothetical protein
MDLEIGKFYTASRPEGAASIVGPTCHSDLEGERDFLEELHWGDGIQSPNPHIADMVPFADTVHDLGYLLIGFGDKNRGRVYHFRDYCHFTNDPNHLFDYAATFAEFLTGIRPERDS